MTLVSEYTELNEISGGLRLTQYAKKIGYRENGSLLAMDQNWEDSGDGTRPHQVVRAPILVTTGNDGLRRIHLTRELDRYVEIGAPFIKTGGVWGKVNLGVPTRQGYRLTWSRPQAAMTVDFGGHFINLDIELKGGFVPEDSQIAFPVGLVGFTRTGTRLFRDGVLAAHLVPPVIIDLDNPEILLPTTNQFVNLSGQPYWLLTLPSLVGLSRPVIDPTVTLQPDAASGIDTWLANNVVNNNFGVSTVITVGLDSTGNKRIGLLKFDLSSVSIPANAFFGTAILTVNFSSVTGTQNIVFYRALVAWDEGSGNNAAGDASWAERQSGVAWGTAGARGSGTDRSASATGTIVNPTASVRTLDVSTDVAAWLTGTANNGWVIDYSDETGNSKVKNIDSSDNATAGNRPKLDITYYFKKYERVLYGVGSGIGRGAR